MKNKNVLFLASNSDFGKNLGEYFKKDFWSLYGTSRNLYADKNFIEIFICDFSDDISIKKLLKNIQIKNIKFDLIINFIGTMEPIGSFKSISSKDWNNTLMTNAINPLFFIRDLLNIQQRHKTKIIFFSGAGTNNAAENYSAYSISKILLIKMAEILDSEYKNVCFCVLGPGILDTKIHKQTFKAGNKAGKNLEKIQNIYNDRNFNTFNNIYLFIKKLITLDKKIIGGRNFSITNDFVDSPKLLKALLNDNDIYKLRRCGNDIDFK